MDEKRTDCPCRERRLPKPAYLRNAALDRRKLVGPQWGMTCSSCHQIVSIWSRDIFGGTCRSCRAIARRAQRKQRMAFLGALLAVLLIGLFAISLIGPGHRINQEGFSKLKRGMTVKEVESILMAPSGDYRVKDHGKKALEVKLHAQSQEQLLALWREFRPGNKAVTEIDPEVWVSDEIAIEVWFDQNGTAIHCQATIPGVLAETFVARFRRWLGL